MNGIPIVDFDKCGLNYNDENIEALKSTGKKIVDAFVNVGFVYLSNTGIDKESIDELNKVTAEFFEKSEEEKKKYKREVNNFGYDKLSSERLAPGKPGDYKQSFNMTGQSVVDPAIEWPDDLIPQFSSVTKSFMKQCRELSLQILNSVSYGLELEDPKYLASLHSSLLNYQNHSSLRCLYYPPVPDNLENGQVRLLEHTDYGIMTLLFQDTVGGLQIKTRDGDYVDACPIEDTVLINVADLLQYWTNGKLKSTPHRILVPSDPVQRSSVRRSIAFFVHPTADLPVSNPILKGENCCNKLLRHFKEYELEKMTVGDYVLSHFSDNYAKN